MMAPVLLDLAAVPEPAGAEGPGEAGAGVAATGEAAGLSEIAMVDASALRPSEAKREASEAAADCSLAASADGVALAMLTTTAVSPAACRRRRAALADTLTQAEGQPRRAATPLEMAADWAMTAEGVVPVTTRRSCRPVEGAGPAVGEAGEAGEGEAAAGEGEAVVGAGTEGVPV